MVDLKKYNARSLQRFFSNHLRMTVFMVVLAVLVSVVAYDMQKSVAIVVNGVPIKVSTYKTTVNGVLLSAGIGVGKKDKVLPGINSKVTNDMTIAIKRAIHVKVQIDGKELAVSSAENTIGDVFKAEGIKLSKSDTVSPKLQTPIRNNLKITVTRVAENTLTMTEAVAYKVLKKTDKNLDKGKVNVVQQGLDGKKELKYKVIYQDGKEISRYLVSEVLKVAPINKIIAVGALAWFTPANNGRKEYYTRKLRVKATSYTKNYACTGKNPGDKGFGITAMGTTVKRNKDGFSTIAVDKSVIPLGTKLYVEGYGYAVAEDVGGAIRGKHIDLYFEPGTKEFRSWSNHQVNVYVLR